MNLVALRAAVVGAVGTIVCSTLAIAQSEELRVDTLMRLLAENDDQLAVYHLVPAYSQHHRTSCARVGSVDVANGAISFVTASGATNTLSATGTMEQVSREKKATSGTVHGRLGTVERVFQISDVRESDGVPYMWIYKFSEASCVASVAPSAGVRRCIVRANAGDTGGAFILTQEVAKQIDDSCY